VLGRLLGHVEGLAVDAPSGDGRRADASPGVDAFAQELDVEGDRARDAADREVALHPIALATQRLEPTALEDEARMVRDVEEVGALEVRVALRDARVDGAQVHARHDAREVGT
jgi:hypothetical protein